MSKRRGNGEGSITLRADGRWMGRFVGLDGRRRTIYGKTRAEVAKRLRAEQKSKEDGSRIHPGRLSVERYLHSWLTSVEASLQPTTFRRYQGLMERQANPEIGRVQLKQLAPSHLQNLYQTWIARGLSPTTVGHLHTVLHAALGQAVRWNHVPRNVAELVNKPRAARREMKTFSADQGRRFLEAIRGDRFEALYVLALNTGLRQGELLALRWRDVQWERRVLQVRGTLQPTREGLRISAPKTKSSNRQVQLGPSVLQALQEHRGRQNAERLLLGTSLGQPRAHLSERTW